MRNLFVLLFMLVTAMAVRAADLPDPVSFSVAIERGDLLVIHDAGAHGHAMGFQYNGKLRCAELLVQENGDVRMIRRAETCDDYFATLDFSQLAAFGT